MTERTIKVEALTRVEGEGGLYIRLGDNVIEDVRLEIYEPPRLFESLLRGRPLEDVPDITARICGICPVAYQMSSVHALESALGISITPQIRSLRRLLYCGEWIESHALHIYLLNAPDFFGCDNAIEMASSCPDEFNRGLRIRKLGNRMLEVMGGRAIHPVNVCVGGFYRLPRQQDLQSLIPELEWCLQAAVETTRWVATFEMPDFDRDFQLVSLQHDAEYPMNEGRLVTSDGEVIDVQDYKQEFVEHHVSHSTALHSVRRKTNASYLCGPLARVNLCFDQLAPTARRVAEELTIDRPTMNPFRAIIARGLELIHACEESLSILRDYQPVQPARVPYQYRSGSGAAVTEAPRGLLYHDYEIESDGSVSRARIIPPTSQNQAQIEADLRAWLPHILDGDDEVTARNCERLVRCYDPCISCSTHFLKVEINRT